METNNYACLCCLLVGVGSQALRDTFDKIHPPTVLHDVLTHPPTHPILQSLKQKKILSTAQWVKLYPIIRSSVSSGSFDILLLIFLLKNICSLNPPPTGWGSLPPVEDTSISANISRVIYYRDQVYELLASQAFVNDYTFNTFWRDISNALVGLGAGAVYWDAINRLKTGSMDCGFLEDYQELLKQWKRDDDRAKDKGVAEIKRKKLKGINEDEEMEGNRSPIKRKKTEEKSKDEFAEMEGIETEQVKQRRLMRCSNSPPRLTKQLPKLRELPKISCPFSEVELPIDVLLLTVEDYEFLSCFSYLVKPFKSYCEIGCLYFGTVDSDHQEKLKIALVKCSKGSSGPRGSLTVVKNAFGVLRPKAVFSVGACSGLNSEITQLGDVVVSSKLTTMGLKPPVSRRIGNIIGNVADGWVAPLENPDEREVKVHCDGNVLSVPLAASFGWLHEDIIQQYPEAIAVEMEGDGLYTAAYDHNVEWMIVKGVASYGAVSQPSNHGWMSFASIMAASVAANILADPYVFQGWPHYNPADINLRLDCEIITRSGAQGKDQGKPTASQQFQGDIPGATVPETSNRRPAIATIASESGTIGNERIPSKDELLRIIAFKSFPAFDVSRPEERNGFVRYLEDIRKALFVSSHQGSLIVTVRCSSLQILERLWEDYQTGQLNEMAQKFLVTEHLLKAFGLVELRLTTTIEEEEYRACKTFFLQQSGMQKISRKDVEKEIKETRGGEEGMVEIKHGKVEESKEDNFGEMEGIQKISPKEVEEEIKKIRGGEEGMQDISRYVVEEETEDERCGEEESSCRGDLSLRSCKYPQQRNNGFGPLSKPRGNYAMITAAILIIISTVVYIRATVTHASKEKEKESMDKIYSLIFGTALLILSFAVGELVRRVCLFIEELQHLQTRYEGNLKKVFTSIFKFNYGRSIFFVSIVSLLIVSSALQENYNTFCRPDYAILFSLNCFLVPLLLFLVGFREPSIVEVSQINERENKNVADGLAWSYYYGYLRIVLPKLDEQIHKSSVEFRYKLEMKKLFILLPKNCYTYDTIDEADTRVKYAGNLEPMEFNRCGIRRRSYKHSVYRIEVPRPDKSGEVDEYLVIMEYATPLMSLYDMSMSPEAGLSRQQRHEQVMLFIRKLKEILDGRPDCKGKYELVTLSGEKNQIADVIVQMHHDARLTLDGTEY